MAANINRKAANLSLCSMLHTIKQNDMDNKIPQEWNDILLKDVTFIDPSLSACQAMPTTMPSPLRVQ